MTAYYNEIDPFAAQWLRNLITAGHIAPGDVDERSIEDVKPDDVRPYKQAHFFAGIGVWSYALRLAGWPDDRAVWTGSCPCQPFSAAGKGAGFADERHLWPTFHWLIDACRPAVVFGEQVASKDGLEWLDVVSTDLENTDYTFAAADMCAAGVAAPHIRQRLYFVAASELGNTNGERVWRRSGQSHSAESGAGDWLQGDTTGAPSPLCGVEHPARQQVGISGRTRQQRKAPWAGCEWIPCEDGFSRAIEPGTFPLVNGFANRMEHVRAYGNALVAQAAAVFIECVCESMPY